MSFHVGCLAFSGFGWVQAYHHAGWIKSHFLARSDHQRSFFGGQSAAFLEMWQSSAAFGQLTLASGSGVSVFAE
ncbi:MAG: hypothetical protein ABWZ39_19425 [Pseudomonas caspiana]|uniref:Uncharacterized protein n=1 Tax=Pseudomonas caspiana TaxID=1451454 RepID=A0A1Y3NVF3_9PSED|nr:hypothetical protein AUC60_22600 [Pseudomonas caspiana]